MRERCPELSKLPGISHGFFTREGGVSEGPFVSLNCGFGSGDVATHVEQNRGFVARALGVAPKNLCTPYQTHSATALIIDAPWPGKAPEADALVTNTPGLAIGVLTADCVPILIGDPAHKVVAAIHAGWKGAISGVIEAGVNAMQSLGATPADMVASIGPAIEQCSYEVGGEFHDRFLAENPKNAAYFDASSRERHFLFDLKGYVRGQLESLGIGHINVLANDTCLEENLFFSYRRATLRGETAYGRQVSAIAIK